MLTYLRSLLTPPTFPDDEEKTRIARLLHIILITVMALVMLFAVPAFVLTPEFGRILIEIVLFGWSLFMLVLLRQGYLRTSGLLFGFTLWAVVSYGTYEAGGFAGSIMSAYIGIVVIIALILGWRTGAVFGLMSVAITGWMAYAEGQGMLPPAPDYITLTVLWIEFATVIIGVVALLAFVLHDLQRALYRARRHEKELALKIEEVQTLANQADEASQFKSRLIARISHELRTPLGALMGMSEMLQNNVYGPLSPAQEDITNRIINNAHLLERVFDELLDQSQIESGQLRLRHVPFSPQQVIEQVCANHLPLAERKGLVMEQQIDESLPHVVVGDEERVAQVVSNLIMNAIKYTPAGTVTVAARRGNNMAWEIEVKDTGIGISEEALAYVFEPFRQVEETVDRGYGGVGLGLSIVQQLVTAMNGRIQVASEVGQGSRFTITLPLQ